MDPLFIGGWTLKKFNATVVTHIWPGVIFFSLIATTVSLVSARTEHKLVLPNALLTVLGVVLGLVISFRTSSAYERYQEGRRMWTNITNASRNIGQMFWIHVSNQRKDQTEFQVMIEKKTIINLIYALSVSVKHFLRCEDGIYYEDLYPLIAFLPRYISNQASAQSKADQLPLWQLDEERLNGEMTKSNGHGGTPVKEHPFVRSWSCLLSSCPTQRFCDNASDPEAGSASVPPLRPAQNPPRHGLLDLIPILGILVYLVRIIFRCPKPNDRRQFRDGSVESYVPLEIMLYISNYSAFLMRSGYLQAAIATGITTNLTTLSDTLSNLERVCNTPLPFAYQIHLRMTLWMYLFFLPFQIWSAFGYLTIPATAFTSFLLLGFLEIGQEIENPFNYDLNDLDLDYFCIEIQRELQQITAHTCPNPSEFVYSALNYPFAPVDPRNAIEITSPGEYRALNATGQSGMVGVRQTLVRSWKAVDTDSRRVRSG